MLSHVAARRAALGTAVGLLCLTLGCRTTPSSAQMPVGCRMVDAPILAGLLGSGLRSVAHGSLADLRASGDPASCTTTASGRRDRAVVVRVVRHPAPLSLPKRACDEGWVFAGTPEKYAPACQQAEGRGGRTELLARWDQYVVRVTVRRPDRNWGGDPELALAMTEQVARRLHVHVPAHHPSASPS